MVAHKREKVRKRRDRGSGPGILKDYMVGDTAVFRELISISWKDCNRWPPTILFVKDVTNLYWILLVIYYELSAATIYNLSYKK